MPGHVMERASKHDRFEEVSREELESLHVELLPDREAMQAAAVGIGQFGLVNAAVLSNVTGIGTVSG
jgi:hypothetical protein